MQEESVSPSSEESNVLKKATTTTFAHSNRSFSMKIDLLLSVIFIVVIHLLSQNQNIQAMKHHVRIRALISQLSYHHHV